MISDSFQGGRTVKFHHTLSGEGTDDYPVGDRLAILADEESTAAYGE